MDLFRKGKRLTDKPLKIEGEACGKRIVDSLYKAGDNYYFLDTGWIDTPTHPDHHIGKMIASDGKKWTFQDDIDRLFYVSPIDDKDFVGRDIPMLEAYKEWKKFLEKEAPNADGADFIRRDLGLGDVEIEQVG